MFIKKIWAGIIITCDRNMNLLTAFSKMFDEDFKYRVVEIISDVRQRN